MATLRTIAIAVFALWLLIDGVVVFRRASPTAENRDRWSLRVLAFGNLLAWMVAITLAFSRYGAIHPAVPMQAAGLVLMGIGILVRSTAIAQLGRFHMPNVAVLPDHDVMQRGLYRHIRHPSYLGALIAFLGFGLALGNWLGTVVLVVLSLAVYSFRIHEEEAALTAVLGEQYSEYARRTSRLIPGVY